MCLKNPFPTQQAARDRSVGFSNAKHKGFRVYYCHQCDAWHFASKHRAQPMRKHKKPKYPHQYIHHN